MACRSFTVSLAIFADAYFHSDSYQDKSIVKEKRRVVNKSSLRFKYRQVHLSKMLFLLDNVNDIVVSCLVSLVVYIAGRHCRVFVDLLLC